MFVDVPFLRSLGTCNTQVELFADTFPDGCLVTRDNLLTAQRAGLDLEWFGEKVFGELYDTYMAEPKAAYNATMTDSWKTYIAAKAKARKVYEAALEKAGAAYASQALSTRITSEASARSAHNTAAAHGEVMEKARVTCAAATAEAWSVYHAAIVDAICRCLGAANHGQESLDPSARAALFAVMCEVRL